MNEKTIVRKQNQQFVLPLEDRMAYSVSEASQLVGVSCTWVTRGCQRLGAGVGARQAQHLMSRIEQFLNGKRTDKASGASNKYSDRNLQIDVLNLSSHELLVKILRTIARGFRR